MISLVFISMIKTQKVFKMDIDQANMMKYLKIIESLKAHNALGTIQEVHLKITSHVLSSNDYTMNTILTILTHFGNARQLQIDFTAYSSKNCNFAIQEYRIARLVLKSCRHEGA